LNVVAQNSFGWPSTSNEIFLSFVDVNQALLTMRQEAAVCADALETAQAPNSAKIGTVTNFTVHFPAVMRIRPTDIAPVRVSYQCLIAQKSRCSRLKF